MKKKKYYYKIFEIKIEGNKVLEDSKEIELNFEQKMDKLQSENWEVCGLIQTSLPGTWIGDRVCFVPMRKLKI